MWTAKGVFWTNIFIMRRENYMLTSSASYFNYNIISISTPFDQNNLNREHLIKDTTFPELHTMVLSLRIMSMIHMFPDL
jgi:hypothetical protein